MLKKYNDVLLTLGDDDLPAKEFDEKWKKDTNFLDFSNAVILGDKIDNMENWITNFDSQLVKIYDAKTIDILSDLYEKRCRDLNYYIDYILHYIRKVNKTDNILHIDEKCTLKKFGVTFPNVTCNETKVSETEIDDLPTKYSGGYLTGDQRDMSPAEYPEDSFSSSPTKIALTSVSTLLGACLSGLYLFRHSFKGHGQRNSESENIFSHENIYDKETGMFSESPLQYSDSPGDINQFYIGYDPI
ncbi:PIR Superfamily Protein [Plasmodium ovale wallikeri]|uniref:PIR Superfamily Protein n=1 Tax=Plasmodium ovale wallikeri TaxID=864142 RepID=A0A1A8YHD4_PLAOA|nr:PIR Superfamily Protein [Plasmodium ovale wallikeri]SBT31555.1 PIR Superfamily Protein [Plasmodium ovale wallikeri]